MQFKSLLVASLMAVGAVAAKSNDTDIAPSVQGRISQLDLGFKQTDVMLTKLKNNIGGVTSSVRSCFSYAIPFQLRSVNHYLPTK